MTPNDTILPGQRLPGRRELAARLVADDQLPDHAIARRCKITKKTLERWKLTAVFRQRVEEYREAFAQAVMSEGIAVRANRIRALGEQWEWLRRKLDERVKTGKPVGVADAVLLRELRETARQAAQETGQWTDVREIRDSRRRRDEIVRQLLRIGVHREQIRELGYGDALERVEPTTPQAQAEAAQKTASETAH